MMLLQMNSCSSFPFKYHPLQQSGSVKPFQPPLTQIYGWERRSQSNKYSTKCCFRSSFYSTNKIGNNNEDIINRNNKSKAPFALQEEGDYESKSQDEILRPMSLVDVLKKKLDAFYRLSRPFAWVYIIAGILSSSLLPVQSVADLTSTFFMQVSMCTVATILMNIFVSTINQLSDVEIDKVNKPTLPLASGDFSMGEGIAIAIITTLTSLVMGVMLRSPPLVISLIIRWILGAAYSINLPFLRWKKSPVMAALTIVILNGPLLQFPIFIHFQKYVFGRPVVFTKPLLFAATYIGILCVPRAILKDLPDVEGDRKFGVRTLAVTLGKERVFSLCVNMLLMAHGGAVLAGSSSSFLLFKLGTMIVFSALGFILWHRSRNIDLSNPKSAYSFFIFILQLNYAEFFLVHFVR